MATKRAKVNKTLEKAKKLVSKKGKKKVTKRSYPEGQNAPQSKAYDMENDKTVPAKRVGYRFTKEGAKKLSKKANDRPTEAEIDKYRNQTFKVKGKVNKSGPKGVGDGSFRYLYIESRADKSDLNKARKLELGGYNPDEMLKLNIYVDVYEDDYERGEGNMVNSYKVDWLKDPQVKASDLIKYISEELYLSENPNNYSIDDDGKIHIAQLQDEDGIYVNNDEQTYKRWKKGEEKLYIAHYFINVTAVKNRKPSVEELAQATGIGTYAKGGKIKVRYVEENEVHDWTLEDVLDVINRDRSEDWTDYDKSDWQEGWNNWVEGEFYSLKDENGKPLNKFEDGGEMAKGGVVFDPKEVREFQEHIFYYYGKNGGLVSELEEGVPATTGEVLKAVSQYLAFINKVNQNFNGFYGSMHRHVVHDIIEYNRNPKTNNYYDKRVIDDMKKTPILEYGGILQPMIGGVNADPRFDIYNTTMFAEKGAELDKGYSKKERVIDYYLNNDIFDDPETYGVSEEDLKEAKKKNDFSKLEKSIIKYHGLNDPSNVEERFEVLGLDDEYAKGGKTKSNKFEFQAFFYDCAGKLITSEYYVDAPSDKEVFELAKKLGAKTGQLYRINYDTGEFIELVADYDCIDEYAKGGETKIYEVATRTKGKSGQFASSVRAKSKEDALRIYKEKHGDDKNKVIVDVYETTRKRLEDGGEMAKGGKTHYQSFEDFEDERIAIKKKRFFQLADKLGLVKGGKYIDGIPEGNEEEVDEFYTLEDELDYPKPQKVNLAHGGKTHEQGYDDREDERLAMRHGKIASKDFVGSHKRREHSRRDDARFETRNK